MSPVSAPSGRAVPDGREPTLKRRHLPRVHEAVFIAGVVAIGAALRFWKLGRDDFWTDEMATIQFASSVATTIQDTHPPLYYLLVHLWLRIAPVDEVSLRLPSVILGIAAIALIYRFTAELFDAPTGLLSAMLLALSTMQLHYSQEARMYALLTFSVVLSSWALLRFMRCPTAPHALLYLISGILLVYSHIFGLIVLCTQNVAFLYVMLASRKLTGRLLIVWSCLQAGIGCSILPWLAYLYAHPGVERVNWIPPATLSNLVEIFVEIASGSRLLLATLGVLALLGCVRLTWRSGRARVSVGDRIAVPYLLLLLGLPVVLAIGLSIAVMPVLISRYLIACSIPLYILAARGMKSLRPAAVQWVAIALAMVLSGFGVNQYFAEPHKLPWQAVAAEVAPRVRDSDLLVFEGFSPDAFDYYAARHGVLGDIERLWIRPDGRAVPADAGERLSRAMAGRERFWLIQGGTREEEQRFNQYVRRTFSQGDELAFPGVRARQFQVRR